MLLHPSPQPSVCQAKPPGRLAGRADLHAHTHYSDGSDSPAQLLAAARRRGLDVLAVTDHDTIEGARRAADLAQRAAGGPDVVVGEEVSSRDGHILGLWLRERVPPGRTAWQTVEAIHAQGGVAIAAHPFWHVQPSGRRFAHGVGRLLAEVAFDAVEIRNGGVTPSMYRANRQAQSSARGLGLIGVGGSDAHVRDALGLGSTAFRGSTAADLRTSLREGTVAALGRPPGARTLWCYLTWLVRRPTGTAAASAVTGARA